MRTMHYNIRYEIFDGMKTFYDIKSPSNQFIIRYDNCFWAVSYCFEYPDQ